MGASPFLLVLAPFAAVAAVLVRRHPRSRRASLARFARRVDLAVPQDLRPRVEQLLAARNLSTDLGGIVGVALAATWALLTRSAVVDGSLWPLVVIGAALTGAAAGAGLTAAAQAGRRPDENGPRLARPTAPTLHDYVAPVELQGGRVAALLPTFALLAVSLGAALSDTVEPGGVLPAGAVTVALLSLVALAGSEMAGRRVVEQSQTASSSLELAWSDALRARVLRDLVTVPICVGTYATFGVLVSAGDVVRGEGLSSTVNGLLGLAALLALGAALASTRAQPQRHFRRRLWQKAEGGAATAGSSP